MRKTLGRLAATAGLFSAAVHCLAYTAYKTVALPPSETGQTVTYTVSNSAGTTVTTGVSGAVVELGGGAYGSAITVPDGANYFLKWTETTGALKSAVDVIAPQQSQAIQFTGANVNSAPQVDSPGIAGIATTTTSTNGILSGHLDSGYLQVHLDFAQPLVNTAAGNVGGGLIGAWATAFGSQQVSGNPATGLTLFGTDGATTIKSFAISGGRRQ